MVSFEHTVLFSFSFNHIKSFATHYVLIFISLTLAACFFFTSLLLKAQFPFFSLQHTHKHTLYSLDSLPLFLSVSFDWCTPQLCLHWCVFSVCSSTFGAAADAQLKAAGWVLIISLKTCFSSPSEHLMSFTLKRPDTHIHRHCHATCLICHMRLWNADSRLQIYGNLMREYRDVYDVKEHAESDTKEGRGVSKN